ncbi:hypothetical protein DFH09DRAFT_1105136 [Mycena vulgaris]|nr:hypothetical protein DFH09DRAFT_1105136 [Mycena vulgaris]
MPRQSASFSPDPVPSIPHSAPLITRRAEGSKSFLELLVHLVIILGGPAKYLVNIARHRQLRSHVIAKRLVTSPGGFTNNQYTPTRTKLILRSFGDLWELRIDEPGGHFEEVGVEEEPRSARAGPRQRCFSCAAAGPWKKCGGALGCGRVTGGCSSAAGHVSRRMEGTQGVA